MNLLTAFIYYAIAILISVALPILFVVLTKKKGYKLNVLHTFFGVVAFLVMFICYFLILKHHLSAADGVTNYYNSPAYRVGIIGLFTVFFAILLWIFGMLVYMRRQSYRSCISFFAGFGSGGCIMVGGYALFMFVTLTIQCLASSFQYFDTNVQAFYFSDETYVSVFLPMSGHLSFAVAAVCLLIIFVSFAWVMCRITSTVIPFKISLISFICLLISLTTFLLVLCFMRMISCPHYLMAIISLLCSGVSLLSVYFSYRFTNKVEGGYRKQFD